MTVLPDAELPDIRPGDTVRKGTRGTVLWRVEAVERYAAHAVAMLSAAGGKRSRGFTHALVLVERSAEFVMPDPVPWAASEFAREVAALEPVSVATVDTDERLTRRLARLEAAGYIVAWRDACPFGDGRPVMFTERQSLEGGYVHAVISLRRGAPVPAVYAALRALDAYLDDPGELFDLGAGDGPPGGWLVDGPVMVRSVGLWGDRRA